MKDDKWVKRWVVPSSSGEGEYIVGQDAEGNYGCSCPGWTRNIIRLCPNCGVALSRFSKTEDKDIYFCWKCKEKVTPITSRRHCKHIVEVIAGGGRTIAEATLDKMSGRVHRDPPVFI